MPLSASLEIHPLIDVICPRCGVVYHSEKAHLGKRIKCSRCGCFVPIADTKSQGIVSVNAERIQVNAPSGVTASPLKRTPRRRSRRSLYAGAFGIVLVVSVWIVWQWNNKDDANPIHSYDQSTPVRADSPPHRYSVDDIADEATSKDEHANRTVSAPQYKARPPEPRPTYYNSLPTGTRITDDVGLSGHGELTISNGTTLDAVVRLYDTGSLTTARWFFVKAGARCSVKAIPEGAYTLAYTSGLDWIKALDTFRWNPTYHQFERSLTYSEQTDATGTEYHEISVTLHPVVGGNVRTKRISREEFLRGHRHVPLQESQSQPTF